MVDTVKIQRPKFPRTNRGAGGRVEHDSRGNAVWVRTRESDSAEPPMTLGLAIIEDPPPATPVDGAAARNNSYHGLLTPKPAPTPKRR